MTLFKRGFRRFLEETTYSDALIVVEPGEQTFKVHRIILSYHSEYFLTRFKEAEQVGDLTSRIFSCLSLF
jgi:hypothetical protein